MRCRVIARSPNLIFATIASLVLSVAALIPLAGSLHAATSGIFVNPAINARLITAENGVAPGAMTLTAGLYLQLGDNWKTYWRSPGEVGIPTSIDWTGSRNVAKVDLLWPAPERFTAFGIENFGYHDQVVLPLRVTLADPGAPVRLVARVNLLTCSTLCVPQEFTLALTLPGVNGIDEASATLISTYADKVPDDGVLSGISIETAHFDADRTALTLTARSKRPFDDPDVFPELGSGTAFGQPDIRLAENNHLLWARLPILSAADDLPVLQITVTDGDRAASLTPDLSEEAVQPPFRIDRALPGLTELAWIAAITLLGGLILIVMPWVFPVLSIKLSAATGLPGRLPVRIRKSFVVSALGVLTFTLLLALAMLVARGFGMTVGWKP